MLRTEIINRLIVKNNYKSYLEIGIGDAVNYNQVSCEKKNNVDPCFDNYDSQAEARIVNRCTSDDFFKTNTEKFDIIFIDGLHEYEQVHRDIINSLNSLNEGGVVLCHDMLPPSEWHQRPPAEYAGGEWNGDCWKAIARLRLEESNLSIITVDTDWGVGIIRKKENGNLKIGKTVEEVTNYSFYESTRNDLMNVVSVDDYVNFYS
jgi:hypothetical protein